MPSPAREQASLNDANAGAFRDAQPSSTETCPLEKGLIAGIFFDGTGNNKYADAAGGSESNVARLYEVYKKFTDERWVREKLYIIGPGAASGDEEGEEGAETIPEGGFWHNIGGQKGGSGGRERLNIAYRWLKAKCDEHKPPEKKLVDTYGFSRGASLARTFVNLVNQALKQEVENVSHRFLGVFDTVGSWSSEEEVSMNPGLDSGDSYAWAHFTARHEHRKHFPLSVLPGADKEYTGVHSDVGGGYADQTPRVRNHIAFVTCNHMYLRSIESTVDMDPPPTNGVNIDQLYDEMEIYGGGRAVMYDPNGSFPIERQRWMATYVHTSTGAMPWNWSTWSGRRRTIQHEKRTIGALPPNFTWR
ncbi:MAG: DUF2235 domain-containing protein [Polyangiaceae bacterium]|nr:DUF2235 domain-containing protein [Polyangiaceae bacterium]